MSLTTKDIDYQTQLDFWAPLPHRGRVTHICVNKLTIISSDNGSSSGRCQVIIWTNAGIQFIGPLGVVWLEASHVLTCCVARSDFVRRADWLGVSEFLRHTVWLGATRGLTWCVMQADLVRRNEILMKSQWKCIWKCRPENGGHFVPLSMC